MTVTHGQLTNDLELLGKGIDRLKRERNELLAALIALVDLYGPSTDYAGATCMAWRDAEAAIAMAGRTA